MMKIDLDKIESVAIAAQAHSPGEWTPDKMMTEECKADGIPYPNGYEGYWIYDRDGDDVVGDSSLDCDVALHIANCSPDVVLELVRRLREAETKLANLEEEAWHAGVERDLAREPGDE